MGIRISNKSTYLGMIVSLKCPCDCTRIEKWSWENKATKRYECASKINFNPLWGWTDRNLLDKRYEFDGTKSTTHLLLIAIDQRHIELIREAIFPISSQDIINESDLFETKSPVLFIYVRIKAQCDELDVDVYILM